MIKTDTLKSFPILIVGVFIIGFSPALVKTLGISGMGPLAIGFWRNIIGAVFLMGLGVFLKKNMWLSATSLKWALLAGLFFALDLNFWHRSVMYAGSGLSTVIGNTQVFITSLLSVFLFRERLILRFILSALVAVAGVFMLAGIMDSNVNITVLYLKGIIYAIVTAFMYAFFLISMKKSGVDPASPSPLVFMGWISLFSGVFMLLGCGLDHGVFLPSNGRNLSMVLLLGVGIQGLGWWLIATSMVKIETHLASLILLLQPAMAMVWGYVFFSETLTTLQIFGAVIVLVSVYSGSIRKKHKKEPDS